MRTLAKYITVVIAIFCASCSLYRPELAQGNRISQQKIDELKPSMSKNQVQALLGNPAIIPILDLERWDYTYAELHGSERDKELDFKLLTLYFKDNKLVGFTGDRTPKQLQRLKVKE